MSTYYHVTGRRHRDSVLRHGLVPGFDMRDPDTLEPRWRGWRYLLWLFETEEAALAKAGASWGGSGGDNDVWRVEYSGTVEPDPDRMPHAVVTTDIVPPAALALL